MARFGQRYLTVSCWHGRTTKFAYQRTPVALKARGMHELRRLSLGTLGEVVSNLHVRPASVPRRAARAQCSRPRIHQMSVVEDEQQLAVNHAIAHEGEGKTRSLRRARSAAVMPKRGVQPVLGAVSTHGSCVSEIATVFGKAINAEVSRVKQP